MLKLSQDSADFGSVVTSESSPDMTITVANIGEGASGSISAAISGAQGSNFSVSTDCTTLAPMATCKLTVKFAPTATGTKLANVAVTANPGGTAMASITGIGIAPGALKISPSSNQFDNTIVGATSSTSTFTITNSGQTATGTLTTVASGSDASQFARSNDTCNGMVLATNATCTVVVAFKPTSSGPKFGSFAVAGTPGGTVAAALNGLALADANLFLNPTSQSFGSVVTGAVSQDVTFNLVNIGGITSGALATTLTGTGASSFSIASNACTGATLDPGASCQVNVHFAPVAAGAVTAQLAFTGTPGGTQTANLSGTGVAPGQISISPSVKQFGNVTLGQVSATQDFVVTNTGGSATGPLSASIPGSTQFYITANNCQGQSLAANGGACTVTARFQPSAVGALSASLNVAGTPGGTASASLSGNGIPGPQLSLSPSVHDYGSVAVGDVTGVQTFTVQNVGGAATGIPMASLSGAQADQFSLTSSCAAVLQPLDKCTLSVRFAPTAIQSDTATLTVTGTPGGSVSANLFGEGVSAAAITVSPSSIAFDTVTIGDNNEQFCEDFVGIPGCDPQFIVTNNGQQTTGPITVTLVGANPGDFAVSSNNCATLAAGQSCVVSIVFAPLGTGNRTATARVSGAPGGTAGVALSGTGIPRLEIIERTEYIDEGEGYDVQDVTDDPYDFGDASAAQEIEDEHYFRVQLGVTLRNNTFSTQYLDINGPDLDSYPDHRNNSADFEMLYNDCYYGETFSDLTKTSRPGHGTSVAKRPLMQSSKKLAAMAAHAHAKKTLSAPGGGGYIGRFGGECFVVFGFGPQSKGAKSNLVTFSIGSTIYDQATQGLKGNGVDGLIWTLNPYAQFAVPVTSLDFGNVALNTNSSTITVSLYNRSDAPTTGPVSVSALQTGPWLIDSTDCVDEESGQGIELDSWDWCNVNLTFHPTVTGPVNEVVEGAATPGGTPELQLNGTGVAAGDLVINPAPTLQFGNVLQGQTTIMSFTVSNLAGSPDVPSLEFGLFNDSCSAGSGSGSGSGFKFGVSANCFTILPPQSGDCVSEGPVPNGTQCTVRVQFTPSNAKSGTTATAQIEFFANPGISGGSEILGISGTAQSTIIASPASPMTYGTVPAGVPTSTRTVTITNQGTTATTLGNRFTISHAGNFNITDNCIMATLPGGGQCVMSFQWTPTSGQILNEQFSYSTLDGNGNVSYQVTGSGTGSGSSF